MIGPTELASAFKDPGYTFQSSNVTTAALELCSQYGKTPEELALQYESFAVTANIQATEIDSALIGRLRTFLAKQERKRKNANRGGNQTARKEINYIRTNSNHSKQLSFQKGPALNKAALDNAHNAKTPSPQQYKKQKVNGSTVTEAKNPTPATAPFQRKSGMMNKMRMKSSYKTRTNKGQILHNLTYNKELLKQEVMDEIQQGFSSSRCAVKVLSSLKRGFPFMYTPSSTKASKLEEQFHNIADQLIKTHKLGNFSQVGVPNQESVLVLGRICCEASLNGTGVLNAESVWLEGSKHDSNGIRVRLNLKSVKAFSVFLAR